MIAEWEILVGAGGGAREVINWEGARGKLLGCWKYFIS